MFCRLQRTTVCRIETNFCRFFFMRARIPRHACWTTLHCRCSMTAWFNCAFWWYALLLCLLKSAVASLNLTNGDVTSAPTAQCSVLANKMHGSQRPLSSRVSGCRQATGVFVATCAGNTDVSDGRCSDLITLYLSLAGTCRISHRLATINRYIIVVWQLKQRSVSALPTITHRLATINRYISVKHTSNKGV